MRVPTRDYSSLQQAMQTAGQAKAAKIGAKASSHTLQKFDLNMRRLDAKMDALSVQNNLAWAQFGLGVAKTVTDAGLQIYSAVQQGRRTKAVNEGLDRLNAINQEETANNGWSMVDDPKNPGKKVWKEDPAYAKRKQDLIDGLQEAYGLDDESLAQVQSSLGQYIVQSRTQQQNATLQRMQAQYVDQWNDTVKDLTDKYVAVHARDIVSGDWSGSDTLKAQYYSNPYITDKDGAWEQAKTGLAARARKQVVHDTAASGGKVAAYDLVDLWKLDADTAISLKQTADEAVADSEARATAYGSGLASSAAQAIKDGEPDAGWQNADAVLAMETGKMSSQYAGKARDSYYKTKAEEVGSTFTALFNADFASGSDAVYDRLEQLQNGAYDNYFGGIPDKKQSVVSVYAKQAKEYEKDLKEKTGATLEDIGKLDKAAMASFNTETKNAMGDFNNGTIGATQLLARYQAAMGTVMSKLHADDSSYQDNEQTVLRSYNAVVKDLVKGKVPSAYQQMLDDQMKVIDAMLEPVNSSMMSGVDKAKAVRDKLDRVEEATAYFANGLNELSKQGTFDIEAAQGLLDSYLTSVTFTNLETFERSGTLEKAYQGTLFGDYGTAKKRLKTAIELNDAINGTPAGDAIVYDDQFDADYLNSTEKHGGAVQAERKFIGGYRKDWEAMNAEFQKRVAIQAGVPFGDVQVFLNHSGDGRVASPVYKAGDDLYRVRGSWLQKHVDGRAWADVADITKIRLEDKD